MFVRKSHVSNQTPLADAFPTRRRGGFDTEVSVMNCRRQIIGLPPLQTCIMDRRAHRRQTAFVRVAARANSRATTVSNCTLAALRVRVSIRGEMAERRETHTRACVTTINWRCAGTESTSAAQMGAAPDETVRSAAQRARALQHAAIGVFPTAVLKSGMCDE